MQYKLGKLPAKRDPRAPLLHGMKLLGRRAPNRLIRNHIDPSPKMLGNDTLGDCTSAGIGNSLRAQSSLSSFMTGVSTDDAIAFYAFSTGYVIGDPATDNGGVEIDVLAYAARNGYPTSGGRMYPLWGSVNHEDMNSIRLATAAFGSTYLGLQLAESDMYQDERGDMVDVWDTNTPVSFGDPTPGSAGGHCAVMWSYTGTGDDDIVEILTWGKKQRATNRWLRSRLDEVHAIAWRQLQPASGLFPSGTDWDRLVADNASFLNGPVAG